MQVIMPYRNLTHTLGMLKLQVIDSMKDVPQFVPDYIQTPSQLFYHFKSLVTYKKDPIGKEYIQQVGTLMDNAGFGDCDCFSVLALAGQAYCNFTPHYVNLAGNRKGAPSHIYTSCFDEEKNRVCVFDLTNARYDYERSYKFKQSLLFRL